MRKRNLRVFRERFSLLVVFFVLVFFVPDLVLFSLCRFFAANPQSVSSLRRAALRLTARRLRRKSGTLQAKNATVPSRARIIAVLLERCSCTTLARALRSRTWRLVKSHVQVIFCVRLLLKNSFNSVGCLSFVKMLVAISASCWLETSAI